MKIRKQMIQTPWWAYALCIAVSVILSTLYWLQPAENEWKSLTANVLCGLISSLLVTFLIDIGNTKRAYEEDWRQFCAMNRSCRNNCQNLMIGVISLSAGIDAKFDFKQRHTYREWITRTFGEYADEKGYDEPKLWALESMVETMGRIKQDCQTLEDWSVVMLGNAYVTDEYRRHLGKLKLTATVAESTFAHKHYETCVHCFMRDVPLDIGALYPDMKDQFEREYAAINPMDNILRQLHEQGFDFTL